MLDWLTLAEPQRLLVSAAVLFVLGLILLAVVPSRDHDLIARRISALRPVAAPLQRRVLKRVERLATATAPLAEWLLGSVGRRQFQRMLGGAGVFPRSGLLLLVAVLLLAAAASGATAWAVFDRLFGGNSILHWGCAGLGVLVGAYLPDVGLRKLAQHRLRAIEFGLPDALDLLVICAEAGLSFETALDRVASELRLSQPGLAGEFVTTSADLRVSPDRDAALAALATWVPIKGMQTVVTALIHSMRYGTPLVQSLRVMASTLRNDALLALEERAGRMPSLMTIPMVLFTLPATFLVLVGPAALRIWDTLHQ
jgi:tight adherence protein C